MMGVHLPIVPLAFSKAQGNQFILNSKKYTIIPN
tara:strand:+ start:1092 stop:1193 length:102 start_codon:yes stop_codon:yes gene_type:complete